MKWFKHYENAHTNRMLQELLSKNNGHELYASYWLLLEFLCGEFKKETIIFEVSTRQLKSALHVSYDSKLSKILSAIQVASSSHDGGSLVATQISKTSWEIESSIILDLMGKSFKRTRPPRVSDPSKKEEERKKNKKIKEKKDNIKIDFDFDKAYALYPKKAGKTNGLKSCRIKIKTELDYNNLLQAIKNYSLQIKNNETEKKYIKQFSTFMNCWEDYLEMEDDLSDKEEAEAEFKSLFTFKTSAVKND